MGKFSIGYWNKPENSEPRTLVRPPKLNLKPPKKDQTSNQVCSKSNVKLLSLPTKNSHNFSGNSVAFCSVQNKYPVNQNINNLFRQLSPEQINWNSGILLKTRVCIKKCSCYQIYLVKSSFISLHFFLFFYPLWLVNHLGKSQVC